MAIVTGKCKWGHDTPGLTNGVIQGTRIVPATLCSACLDDPSPEARQNAGRIMHPDRYGAWIAKRTA